MGTEVNIPWIEGTIPWVRGQDTKGRWFDMPYVGVNIPLVGGPMYHGNGI
jgi:hypothetical protein